MTPRQLLSVVLAAATAGFTALSATRAETTRTVYISAADSKSGAIITDLKKEELTIKEDGKERAIADLKAASAPMDVTVLDDDSGSGVFQPAVLEVFKAFMDKGKITLGMFTPQANKLADNTSDFKILQDALNKLGPRGKVDHDGNQIAETIGTWALAMKKRESPRPILIVLTIGGAGGEVRNANFVMDQLASSGASLNVVYISNADVGQVIGDGPRQSGGRIEQAPGINALPAAVQKIIDSLKNQYVVTYTLPDGVKPSDRVNISTTRKGINLYAPTRIPK